MTRVREWQPGEVAMVTAKNRLTPYKAIYVDGIWVAVDDIRPSVGVKFPVSINSLVTLDPEDREQVERLWDSIMGRTGIDDLSDALREFADPKPRIEEPTGLGAVVEAVCGCGSGTHRFIHDPLSPRFEGRPCSPDKNWKAPCGHHKWSDLDVVRVLSEGVTA